MGMSPQLVLHNLPIMLFLECNNTSIYRSV